MMELAVFHLSRFLIPLVLLPVSMSPVAAEPLPCSDKSVVAAAIRTREDVQAFVQCAYEFVQEVGVEEARRAFHQEERWRSGAVYIFGVDRNGNTLFSGDLYCWSGWTSEGADSELTSLSDRDDLSVADTLGETFFYYLSRNPSTGIQQRRVVFVKRVVTHGLPILIGSGYNLEDEQ